MRSLDPKLDEHEGLGYYWSMVCLGFSSVALIIISLCILSLLRQRLLEMFGL